MDLKEAIVLAVHPATHSVDLIIDDPDDPDEILESNVHPYESVSRPYVAGGTVALPKVGTNVLWQLLEIRCLFLDVCRSMLSDRIPK